MLAKKKKLSKKQIKEDKLVTYYTKILDLTEDYKQQLLIAAGVIVVIIAAIYIYNNKQEENQIAASTELSKILPIYEQKNYQQAISGQPGTSVTGLETLVDNYGSSEAGEVAKIYLGNSNYYLGNYQQALDHYGDYSGDLIEFKAASLAGQAACYYSLGNYEEAAKFYKKAANVSKINALNPSYLLSSGKMFILSGDLEEAEEIFKSIKEDYKKSTEASEIDRYIAEVKLKMESGF